VLRPAWGVLDELVTTVSPALLRHGEIETGRDASGRLRSHGSPVWIGQAGTVNVQLDASIAVIAPVSSRTPGADQRLCDDLQTCLRS
jgi:hypothetical protein